MRIVPTGIPGETVAIDKITLEDDYATSWLSKYAGDPATQYRGARPRGLYRQLDRELERHGRTINHPSNPLGKLILVTNTKQSVALLQQRAREVLGADFPVTVKLMP
ncbi:hypothetical protein [Actinomyces qiguomingii]|uniref:hypothetical protein n=1 Tax=Actinomyces qiguomingii TaxID=2057800 RepID=UPI000FFE711F|nr:hypothetical protein [Actinomyces qiguomingii]